MLPYVGGDNVSSWRSNEEFNSAMDGVYRSFMKQKKFVEGKHDRDVRDPSIVLNIARKLELIPDANQIVRITGSKGKGTTSRMIAKILAENISGNVGLFVSPEEIDHNDRMSVNGDIPSRGEFAKIFNWLNPYLEEAQGSLGDGKYISPFGVFLLIALKYFKDKEVSVYVLEGGRGAEFDEVGNIPSKIGVVTSILSEHAASIGPTLDEVAKNKLYIGLMSECLIISEQFHKFNDKLDVIEPEKISVVNADSENKAELYPEWIDLDIKIAINSVQKFLGKEEITIPNLLNVSAAFGIVESGGRRIYYDGSVNLSSLDIEYLTRMSESDRTLVVLASLPDDKDVKRIRDFFVNELGIYYREIALSGTRGYLHYDDAKSEGVISDEINYEDIEGFWRILDKNSSDGKNPDFYCIGTQTYIRLVKMSAQKYFER